MNVVHVDIKELLHDFTANSSYKLLSMICMTRLLFLFFFFFFLTFGCVAKTRTSEHA